MHYMLVDSMEIEILNERENKFFNRKDLMIKVKHKAAATPSKAELVEMLAKRYKVDSSQVIIDYIFTMRGISESKAKVKILNEKPKRKVEEKEKEEKPIEEQTKPEAQPETKEGEKKKKETKEGERSETQAGKS